MTFKWTDERIGCLKQMWRSGLSCSKIARSLGDGLTRSAVVGKIHRLGIAERSAIPADVKRWVVVPEKLTCKAAEQIVRQSEASGPPSLRIPLAEIGPDQCRYIAGDVRIDATCCGHPVKPLTPWCPYHLARCYNFSATEAARHAAEAARMLKRVA